MKSLIGFGRRPFGKRLGIAALVLVGAAGTVMASHEFADVPDSHPFHAAISNLVGAGITGGCDVGLYCPDSPVTRAQMAAFMGRSLGRVAVGSIGPGGPTITATPTDYTLASITTGGIAGKIAFVKADTTVNVFQGAGDATGAARVRYTIVAFDGATQVAISPELYGTIIPATNTNPNLTIPITWRFRLDTAKTYTFKIRILKDGGNAFLWLGTMTLSYFPFGAAGSSAAPEVADVPEFTAQQ